LIRDVVRSVVIMRFTLHPGADGLIEKLRRDGISLVVETDRENVCREKGGKNRDRR